jgi:hypothetical protein
MFGALGSPPSYTALGWQDQKTKNYIGFFLWGNYKTLRRREEQNSKPERAEVAEGAEGRLAHCERRHKIGRFSENHRGARRFCPLVMQTKSLRHKI